MVVVVVVVAVVTRMGMLCIWLDRYNKVTTRGTKSELITEDHDTDGSDDATEGVFSCIRLT